MYSSGRGRGFFNNALIGTPGHRSERRGLKSVRIKGTGSIRMNFDYTGRRLGGNAQICAFFGTDGSGTWELQVSSDGGNSFRKSRETRSLTSSSTLQTGHIPGEYAREYTDRHRKDRWRIGQDQYR